MESGIDLLDVLVLSEEEMDAVGGAGVKELADRVYRK
jgi:stage V sporulation protein SpoVS